jgi:hypothetical protein
LRLPGDDMGRGFAPAPVPEVPAQPQSSAPAQPQVIVAPAQPAVATTSVYYGWGPRFDCVYGPRHRYQYGPGMYGRSYGPYVEWEASGSARPLVLGTTGALIGSSVAPRGRHGDYAAQGFLFGLGAGLLLDAIDSP